MGQKLDPDKRLQISYMAYNKKVLKAFQLFPFESSYNNELYQSLLNDHKKGYGIVLIRTELSSLELQVHGLWSIRKTCIKDDDSFYLSFFDYKTEDDIISENFSYTSSGFLCDNVLPFVLSKGRDRTRIPLIINYFRSFARYALSYVPSSKRTKTF